MPRLQADLANGGVGTDSLDHVDLDRLNPLGLSMESLSDLIDHPMSQWHRGAGERQLAADMPTSNLPIGDLPCLAQRSPAVGIPNLLERLRKFLMQRSRIGHGTTIS
jgi:hypothetical protein